MSAAVLLVALVCAQVVDGPSPVAPPPDPLRVPERVLGDDARREQYFDTNWILPTPPAETHLAARMADFAALRFEPPADAAARAAWTRSVGDLVRAFGERRRDAAATEALLAELEREHPDVWARVARTLPPLVRTQRVYSRDWDPDEARKDDGFLQAESWSLKGREERPWSGLEGDRDVQQLATLVWSDPVTLKTAESDYTTYMQRVGNSLLEVGVAPGSLVRGVDARGPFQCMRTSSRSDLPFPFGSYRADVDVLCEPGAGGGLVTHVVSRSPDFYWLAGRDHWIPVRDADGTLVATLIVRELGFDLDGVPDGDSARRAAIRSAVGNLKREAEALGLDPDASLDGLPEFPVRSPR